MMNPRPHSNNTPGGDLKFRVTPHIDDFQIAENQFKIIVRNQAGRVCYVVPREDCFWDDQGRWYFGLEHVQEGLYEAIFEGKLDDDDYDKQQRVEVDRQLLCAVGRYTMPPVPKPDAPPNPPAPVAPRIPSPKSCEKKSENPPLPKLNSKPP